MTRPQLVSLTVLALAGTRAAGGEIESYWIGGGFFDEAISWNGPPPDENVACVFDIDVDPGPFVAFRETGLSGRCIVRAGHPYFMMWDTDPEGVQFSHHYDVVNPSFNTPSLIVAENPGEDATLTVAEGFVGAQSVVLGMGAGSYGEVVFSAGLFGLTAGLSCVYELHVGGGGQGLLTIDNGVVVTAGETVLGVAAGSMGTVVLTEPGSRLEAAGPLTAGRQGQGTLTVSDQAGLVSTDGLIGQQPGAIGEVSIVGQGASWTTNGSLDVGFQGMGTLSITGGGAVFTDGFATIGTLRIPDYPFDGGGVGEVTVDGPASLWLVDGDLYVGVLWQGTLNVTGGALVTSQSGVVGLDSSQSPVANVEGIGSVWSTIESVSVGENAVLRVAGGGLVIADLVDVLESAELAGDGTVLGDVESAGTVRPGDPLGTLTVQGDFSTEGELAIELAGTGPGRHDAVSVINGDAFPGGSLAVSDVGLGGPQVGDSFTILSADAVSGEFSSVSLPPLDPGLLWSLDYQPSAVVLMVTSNGDFNGDGLVGIDDFLIVLGTWGPCPEPCPPCPGDADGDCVVGITDLLVVLGNWTL